MVNQEMRERSFQMKLVFEFPVWTRESMRRQSLVASSAATGCAPLGHVGDLDPNWVASQFCQGYSQPPKAPRVPFLNMGTSIWAPACEAGKPSSPAMSQTRGGVSVVVRARESRAHGEGRQ